MKKLMIAAAIICAAIISQAASLKWACTNVYKDSENKNSGVAYLMLASNVEDFTTLAGKGATAVNDALSNALISYTPAEAGLYTLQKTNAELNLNDSASYGDAYVVIFDTATVSDASKFYVTAAKDLETLGGDYVSELKFNSQATASKKAENWHAVAAAVPEPTSGLLLLLGVAGLALRRRRA